MKYSNLSGRLHKQKVDWEALSLPNLAESSYITSPSTASACKLPSGRHKKQMSLHKRVTTTLKLKSI